MQLNKLEELLQLAKDAGQDNEEMRDTIMTILESNNESDYRDLREYLFNEAKPQFINPDPFFPYPSQDVFTGDLTIGYTKDNVLWRVDKNELCKNLLCTGIVGSGKTTVAYAMAHSLTKQGIKILNLGLKKDFRHVACDTIPMLVLRCARNGNFHLGNIFKAPAGVDEIDYQTAVIKCFAITTFIAESGKALLLDVVNTLIAKQGYADFPSLLACLKKMHSVSRRQADWLSTCINRVTEFQIMFGPILAGKDCFPFENVLETHSIELELDGAGEYRFFFPALVILRAYKHRIANNLRGNILKTAILCDEVNILASKAIESHAAQLGALPTLIEYLPLSREFGFGYISFSNQPTEISNVLKAQSGIKMTLRLGSWKDVLDMGNCMILNQDQMKVIVDMPPGYAIVKMAGIDPFPVQLPNYDVKKNKTDDDIHRNNCKLLHGMPYFDYLISEQDRIRTTTQPQTVGQEENLDVIERAFLFDVYNRPDVGLTERYRTLGMSIGQGDRLVDSIDNKVLINTYEINLSGRGANTKFLDLTQKGYSSINMVPKKRISKGGGFLHQRVQNRIAGNLKQIPEIKNITIEAMLNNKAIDILAVLIDNKKLAFEIAMSPLNELNNVQKDLAAECDFVFIVCKDKKVGEKVNELIAQLNDNEKALIKVCIVYQILKCKTLADIFVLGN